MIIHRDLAQAPYIKTLIQQQHTQPVTYFQHSEGRGIMADTYGIVACGLQEADFTFLRFCVGAGPQQAVIMMQTSAFQLHSPSIQAESILRIHRNRTDSKGILRSVPNLLPFFDKYPVGIQHRRIRLPSAGLLHRYRNTAGRFLT